MPTNINEIFPPITLERVVPLRTYSIECQTCTDCKLPIGGTGTTAVAATTCDECRLVITFTKGKTSKIDAHCIATGDVCDYGISKNSDQSTVVAACCDTDNCNTVPAFAGKLLYTSFSLFTPIFTTAYFLKLVAYSKYGFKKKHLHVVYLTTNDNSICGIACHLFKLNMVAFIMKLSFSGRQFFCFIGCIEPRKQMRLRFSDSSSPALPKCLTLRKTLNFTSVRRIAAVNRDCKIFHQQA
ncbi:hypothetical protein T265_14390, partial [Opisthorchis viverrini]